MRNDALIIFVRKPELGKVKTRIAAKLGDETALTVYQKLLQHTFEITRDLPADKFVFYAGDIEEVDIWQTEGYDKLVQEGEDLGQRMNRAFETITVLGYQKVCIIGSDCFELTTEVIQDAFAALAKSHLVLGPAYDGGYYLLGLKQLHSSLFINKSWSTNSVCSETIATAQLLNLNIVQLPLLHDVDEAEDVPKNWLIALKK